MVHGGIRHSRTHPRMTLGLICYSYAASLHRCCWSRWIYWRLRSSCSRALVRARQAGRQAPMGAVDAEDSDEDVPDIVPELGYGGNKDCKVLW